MKVILAGYNLDHALIAQLRERSSDIDPESLSPETLSAAYARISRDPRPIPELRADAVSDVTAARKSNERIIFGFGHASVAEHAVFNLDILGISRVAMEALEAARLASYTEKSQRYITLDRDYVVPSEVVACGLGDAFEELIKHQQEQYENALARLETHYQETDPQQWAKKTSRRALEGAAKEDARYFLSMATTGQVGVTLNARTLEGMVRRLTAEPLSECQQLGAAIHEAVTGIAPSLVRYTDATPYRRETPAALRKWIEKHRAATPVPPDGRPPASVRLIDAPQAGDDLMMIALVAGHTGQRWETAEEQVRQMTAEDKRELIVQSLRLLGEHDTPLRHFELPCLTFELVVSSSCFAQLKRHRMATLLCQPYQPALGITIPPGFETVGLVDAYRETCRATEAFYDKVQAAHPEAAVYALTNGHRRRVIFKANARELYHLARLRLDAHAQWDIRQISEEMIAIAKKHLPLTMLLAAGKDRFAETREMEIQLPAN